MVKKNNSALYGIFAGIGLIGFYLGVVSIFQGFEFALLNLRNLWYLIFPLAGGFGTQIGLFFSIRHTAQLAGTVAGTGTISGGSMLACCSHFLLNMIPIAGFSGLAVFLVKYQAWFLGVGIVSNVVGIGLMLRHKKGMLVSKKQKGNRKFPFKHQRYLKARQKSPNHSPSERSQMKGGACCESG